MALAAALVVPLPAGLGAQPGRITGTVEVSHDLTARRPQFRVYSDPGRTTPAVASPADELRAELRNVVIYLVDDRGTRLPASGDSVGTAASVMAQARERFDPRVLPVLAGSRVEFPNYDDIYHNVFSLSRARTFDLGRYPRGSTRAVDFPRSGVVQVFCHIHADMSGVVLVLGNPFFATPRADGTFIIENVPPGEYTIVGWHERTRPAVQRVQVTAGGTATADFRLPLSGGSGE